MRLGTKINELRKAKNMTLRELAKKSGVSAVTLTNWKREKTRPQLVAVSKVANALGIDLKILIPYLKER